jgi:hypothetical protein
MTFSFSTDVWNDLIFYKMIVLQDDDNIYVIYLNGKDGALLPRPTQQRSVLIKNWIGQVTKVNSYKKSEWQKAEACDWNRIMNFMRNNNNHTTSDWNCVGIRVMPNI